MTRTLLRIDRRLVLAALTLILAGCGKDPVTTYTVPHEEPARHVHTAAADMGAGSTNAPTVRDGETAAGAALEWTKPAAWTEKPASQMRLASYGFTAADGAQVDVSVTSFPDAAGGLLANLNRWRGQLGLPPVSEGEIEQVAQRTEVAGQVAWLVDFAGTPPAGAPAMGATPAFSGPTRILGAIVPVSGTSWFFKMIGPDGAVAGQREAFQELVASIRAVTPGGEELAAPQAAAPAGAMPAFAGGADPHAGIAGAPPLGAGAPMAGDPHAGIAGAPPLGGTAAGGMDPSLVPPPPKAGNFSLETPPGWEPLAPSAMRVASFRVPGPGVPPADVSVLMLGGPAGGELSNVNRWRGQLRLGPIGADELARTTTKIAGADGMIFDMVDIESSEAVLEGGHRGRILAAILAQPGRTWFIKMTGETGHVASQRETFVQFLESFRLEPAPGS